MEHATLLHHPVLPPPLPPPHVLTTTIAATAVASTTSAATGTPRAATIRATEEMKCFVMDRDTYRAILMGAIIKKRELYDQVRSPVVVQCAL
jgi:hypothetical protein